MISGRVFVSMFFIAFVVFFSQNAFAESYSNLSVEDCINIALKCNHQRQASKYAVDMAEAQHRQTLSLCWPQLTLNSTFTSMGDDPNFIFPSNVISVPSSALTIPANSFAQGFPPQNVQMQTPASRYVIPEQQVKLMDRNNLATSLSLSYNIFTGGAREAVVKQAECGVEIAKEEFRRTDLQVIYDVKRMYYGYVLAKELHNIGKDMLMQLETTFEITENLYRGKSCRVKKTDYLRNKVIVEYARSLVAIMEGNEETAKSALINTMGLEWDTPISIAEGGIPYNPYQADLKDLIKNAYSFNPDWAKLKSGLIAAGAKINEANSGTMPKLALTGSLNFIGNSYNSGLVTPQNKNSSIIGITLVIPFFDGFLTLHKIKEAKARLEKMEHERILLKEGIALQIKQIFLKMVEVKKQQQSLSQACDAAEENSSLNISAYKDDLVETKDVIEAQMVESFMKAQYKKVLYEHAEVQFNLDYVVGKEINKLIQEKTANDLN